LCVGANNTQTVGIAQVQAVWLFGYCYAMVVNINLYRAFTIRVTKMSAVLKRGLCVGTPQALRLGNKGFTIWGAELPMVILNENKVDFGGGKGHWGPPRTR